MRERKIAERPEYSALACAVIEDGGRVLFLKRVGGQRELLELPCVLVERGMDPVSALKGAVLAQMGIDAQVGEVLLEGRHNCGSRRRKRWIPALGFRVTAKNLSTREKVRWIPLDDAKREKLGRNAEWIRAVR